MSFHSEYNVNEELCDSLTIIYEILMELEDIKDGLKKGKSITHILHPPFDPFKTITHTTVDMSTFSSDDSYSAPSPIPSPQELSNLITDDYMVQLIASKFNNKPTSSAILQYYNFLSRSIATLEEELERHQIEHEVLHNHLLESQTFRHRIRPIVGVYRHRCALKRRGHHPYGRKTPSTTSSSSSEDFPSSRRSPS